ncbi:Glycosyl transferase [Flavobacterium sp. 9AF]|nr:Glycosyl transferase [Flavobacterium sp. 9AF]
MPFFSIIIPVYNKAEYIHTTLKSVFAQKYQNFEIIIVDDGSTDESIKKINQITDSRITLFKQENKGVSTARNLGIKQAKGKLIAFLDADDYWLPNHLEELFLLYSDFPNCGIYCNLYTIKTTEKYFQEINFRGIEKNFRGIVPNYFYSSKPFRIAWTSALAIPKNILDLINGFNENSTIGEDIELWTHIGINYPVALSNKKTAIYNYHIPFSLSKKRIDSVQLMNFIQFEKDELTNKYLKEFLDVYRFFYAIQFKAIGNNKKAQELFKNIDKRNIGLQNLLLFFLPSALLKSLYFIKQKLKYLGIEFSTYN